jgi:hypothetical protein
VFMEACQDFGWSEYVYLFPMDEHVLHKPVVLQTTLEVHRASKSYAKHCRLTFKTCYHCPPIPFANDIAI